MKKLFLLTFLILSTHIIFAQRNIKGFVMNEMGEYVPFAHVQDMNNPKLNTSANEEGAFELPLENKNYVFKVSARNYKTEEFEMQISDETIDMIFVIINVHNTYDEVVIMSGEDPGVKKMREVIAKREKHASYLKSLATNVYLKGNLKIIDFPEYIMGQKVTDTMLAEMGLDSNKQGIMYLLEQHTKYYYQAPNKTFNEVQSVRTSGDPQGLGFAQMPPIINIYENNIHILDGLSPRGIVSPAHSNALHFYNFKLVDIFEDNGKTISKISVTPKRKYEPLFTGYVYVVENDWIFHSVELSIDRSTGIDMLDSLQLIQSYANYENDQWIIQNQVIIPHLSMFGILLSGSFLTHYTHDAINSTLPAGIFDSKVISKYDKTALDKDSSYWNDNRRIPLTELEEKNFVKGDSLNLLRIKNDSIYKSQTHSNFDFTGILISGPYVNKYPNSFKLNSLLDAVQFNNVEGLNITLKPSISTEWSKQLHTRFSSQLRYGFASERFYGTLKGEVKIIDKTITDKQHNFSIEGGRYITDMTQLMPISELYNTYTALSGKNYLSFYEKTFLSAKWKHTLGNGLSYGVQFDYEDRKPLENNTDYTWFKRSKKDIRPNQPSGLEAFLPHKAAVVSAHLEYQPGWTYIEYPHYTQSISSSAPIFRLTYSKGIENLLGSDVNYDKFTAGMRYNMPLRLLGLLKINLEGGTFLNKKSVGIPDLFHNKGNQILLANEYMNSFQLADYYALSHSDAYGKLHLEWHMNGFLSNKVPLLNKLNWNFVISNNTLFFDTNNYYTELAFGIENLGYNLYRFGRVDYFVGYNALDKRYETGVRIGFSGLLTGMVSLQ